MSQATLFTKRGGIHYAHLETSARLRRVLALLCDGQKHSPMDINTRAHSLYNPAITELNAQGIDIHSAPRCKGAREHDYWISAESLGEARRRLQETGGGPR